MVILRKYMSKMNLRNIHHTANSSLGTVAIEVNFLHRTQLHADTYFQITACYGPLGLYLSKTGGYKPSQMPVHSVFATLERPYALYVEVFARRQPTNESVARQTSPFEAVIRK